MWDWFPTTTILGWDYLTPQGIRLGIASFIAVTVLAPARPRDENIFNAIMAAGGGLLVAQAVSLGLK